MWILSGFNRSLIPDLGRRPTSKKNVSGTKKNLRQIFNKLSEIFLGSGIHALGSMNQDPEKNISRIQGSKKERISDPDPQHCWRELCKTNVSTSVAEFADP
jgi:hypothetical protein